MVRWQCELRVSFRAQLISLLLHGVVILLLLQVPWPVSGTLVWMLLLALVLLECVRSQRRIRSREGEIALLASGQLRWRHREWRFVTRPWLSQQMMLLPLQNVDGQRELLWLFADAMHVRQWRLLRQQLLIDKEPENK